MAHTLPVTQSVTWQINKSFSSSSVGRATQSESMSLPHRSMFVKFIINLCPVGYPLPPLHQQELQLHLGVLQQHAAFMSGPSASTCPICHKLFLNVETLLEHMKFVHKDIAPNLNSSSGSQNVNNDNQSSNQSTINLSASTKMHSPTTTPRPQDANDQNSESQEQSFLETFAIFQSCGIPAKQIT